jgi:excinuclease ABC subunit C
VQTLQGRQQKMATAELGHRDVFGMKRGPAGVVIQIFQVRRGRVVERIELGTEEPIVGSRDGEILEAALQQFYELRGAPPEVHVPAEPNEREGARGVAVGPRRTARGGFWCPQRGEKRGFVDLANRNAALAYQTRFNQTKAAQYDALETLAACAWLPALPRRIRVLRHLDDPGQRDGGVDGRLRRRPHAPRGVPQVSGSAGLTMERESLSRAVGGPCRGARLTPRAPSTSARDDFAAIARSGSCAAIAQLLRAGRTVSRSRVISTAARDS